VIVREQTGPGGGIDIQVPRSISEARIAQIERDCSRKTGGGPGSGRQMSREQQAEMLDQALKFARCMRAHGVAMADPTADGRGIKMGIKGSKGDGPAVQRAQRACESLMPRKPGAPKSASSGGGSK
jgi:hypothetical protein